MRCPNCGTENKDGELFCQSCGTLIVAEMPVIGEGYLDEEFVEQPALRLEPESDEKTEEFWHSVQWINTSKREEKAAPVEGISAAVLDEESLSAIPAEVLGEESLSAIPAEVLGEEPLSAIPAEVLSEEPLPVYAHGVDQPERAPALETARKHPEAVPMGAIMEDALRAEPVRVKEKHWNDQKKQAQKPELDRRPRQEGSQNTDRTPNRNAGKNRPNNSVTPRNPQGGDDAFKNNAGYSDVMSGVKDAAKKISIKAVPITEERKGQRKTPPVPPKNFVQMLPWVIALVCLLLLLIVLFVRCDGTPPSETTDPVETGGASVHTPVDTVHEGNGVTEMSTEQTVPETKEPVYETVYRVIAADVSWEEAKRECEARGGTLATITSAEEFEAVCAEANKSGLTYLWLGARLEGADWANQTWITGEAMTFTKWYDGEPSYFDTGDNVKELCLCMWKVKKDVNDWTFNDQRNDPIKDYPKQFSGKTGYVLELKVEVTQ